MSQDKKTPNPFMNPSGNKFGLGFNNGLGVNNPNQPSQSIFPQNSTQPASKSTLFGDNKFNAEPKEQQQNNWGALNSSQTNPFKLQPNQSTDPNQVFKKQPPFSFNSQKDILRKQQSQKSLTMKDDQSLSLASNQSKQQSKPKKKKSSFINKLNKNDDSQKKPDLFQQSGTRTIPKMEEKKVIEQQQNTLSKQTVKQVPPTIPLNESNLSSETIKKIQVSKEKIKKIKQKKDHQAQKKKIEDKLQQYSKNIREKIQKSMANCQRLNVVVSSADQKMKQQIQKLKDASQSLNVRKLELEKQFTQLLQKYKTIIEEGGIQVEKRQINVNLDEEDHSHLVDDIIKFTCSEIFQKQREKKQKNQIQQIKKKLQEEVTKNKQKEAQLIRNEKKLQLCKKTCQPLCKKTCESSGKKMFQSQEKMLISYHQLCGKRDLLRKEYEEKKQKVKKQMRRSRNVAYSYISKVY